MEIPGLARQVAELLQTLTGRYIPDRSERQRFCVFVSYLMWCCTADSFVEDLTTDPARNRNRRDLPGVSPMESFNA